MYKLYDRQWSEYKEVFESLEDVKEYLADYHSIDWSGQGDIYDKTLDFLLDYGDWEIHDKDNNIIIIN